MVLGRWGFPIRRYGWRVHHRYYQAQQRTRPFWSWAAVAVLLFVASLILRHASPSVPPVSIIKDTVVQMARDGARLGPALGDWLSMDSERGRLILQQNLPTPAESRLENPPQLSWRNRLRFWLYMAMDYDITQPKTLLESALPHYTPVAMVVRVPQSAAKPLNAGTDPVSSQPDVNVSPTDKALASDTVADTGDALAAVRHANTPTLQRLQQADWGDQPLVLIYHTHTSEMYGGGTATAANPAEPHRYNSTATGVVRVGEVLARTLSERYGIPVVHSTAIHDFPNFAHAYTSSAKTVRALLAKYPSIQVVIDVHRDAAENVSFVRDIRGVQAAQVMVVVSKLGQSKPALHPRWRENMQFAEQLKDNLQALYPGMLRQYPPVTARYNQNLHPHAVLLEIGNYMDDERYALRSAAMMADAIAMMVDDARRNPVRATVAAPAANKPVAGGTSVSTPRTPQAATTAKSQTSSPTAARVVAPKAPTPQVTAPKPAQAKPESTKSTIQAPPAGTNVAKAPAPQASIQPAPTRLRP